MRPPPRRTAYFSRTRQPGVVFRVSTKTALEPATRAAMARVKVAMPERRWRKLRATRSPVRIEATGPVRRARTVPAATSWPSSVSASNSTFRIQLTKNPGRHGQARHHQGGLGPDMGLPLQLRVHHGLGGDISRADILFQGQVDEAVKWGELSMLSINKSRWGGPQCPPA